MIASDRIRACFTSCEPGAVHIWVPAFTGATDALLSGEFDGAAALAHDAHLVLGAVEIARGVVGSRARQRVGLAVRVHEALFCM